MTSQEKKRWLQRYHELGREIERVNRQINVSLQEIDTLRATAERTTTVLSDMPSGGGFKSREDIYIKLVDMSNEVNKLVDGYVDKKREAEELQSEITQAISQIDDATLKQLLWLRYIDGLVFEQIAVDMGYCIMQVWRLHGKALERLAIKENMLCNVMFF